MTDQEENNRSQEDNAYLILTEDLTIKKFDIDRTRAMAKDPNPHISGTASLLVDLLEKAAEIVEFYDESPKAAAEAIRNLQIVDGDIVFS